MGKISLHKLERKGVCRISNQEIPRGEVCIKFESFDQKNNNLFAKVDQFKKQLKENLNIEADSNEKNHLCRQVLASLFIANYKQSNSMTQDDADLLQSLPEVAKMVESRVGDINISSQPTDSDKGPGMAQF